MRNTEISYAFTNADPKAEQCSKPGAFGLFQVKALGDRGNCLGYCLACQWPLAVAYKLFCDFRLIEAQMLEHQYSLFGV